jgi:hypothetical protein
MKKLLIGLLSLGSITAMADTLNGVHLPKYNQDNKVSSEATEKYLRAIEIASVDFAQNKKFVTCKGYAPIDSSNTIGGWHYRIGSIYPINFLSRKHPTENSKIELYLFNSQESSFIYRTYNQRNHHSMANTVADIEFKMDQTRTRIIDINITEYQVSNFQSNLGTLTEPIISSEKLYNILYSGPCELQ